MRLTDEQIMDIKEYLNRSIKITISSLIPRISKHGLDLIDTIEALQQENNGWRERYDELDAGHSRLFKDFCKLQQENEQLQARVERMRELLAKAYDEIETYKCLWKSSKPSGCDCPKPTALQDEIEQALAAIDKAIGGKEDV